MRPRWLAILGLLICTETFAEGKTSLGQSETRPVRFSDSNPEQTRFGKLEFLGGLEWWSERADFGGFSGMLLDDDLSQIPRPSPGMVMRYLSLLKAGLAAVGFHALPISGRPKRPSRGFPI